MSDKPIIRDAVPDDIPTITTIYAGHVREGLGTFELQPPSEEEMAQRLAVIHEANLPYLVAELDDQIAGYSYASSFRPRPAYCNTVEDSVYTAPWAQRRGIGRILLDDLIGRCESIGKRQMIAVIGDSDNVASIALHQAAGFHHIGILQTVGFKQGQWVDIVMMQRALGPGANTLPEC